MPSRLRSSRPRRLLSIVLEGTRERLRGHDLLLASAGATLYGALAGVPTVLVAIRVAGAIFGRGTVLHLGDQLAQSLPDALGAGQWVASIFRAGSSLSLLGVVFAAFVATAYGRGLSRALRRFAPSRPAVAPARGARGVWLPGLGLAPLLLVVLLVVTPLISRLSSQHGFWGFAGASYLALNLVWVLTWLPLTWAYRVVTPGRPAWPAALAGAVAAGAFVSGFLQGFVVFLALPVDLARPFGGLEPVGVTVALLLWLWVLHVVFCVGYALTWAFDAALEQRSGDHGREWSATTGISSVSTPSTAASSGLCGRTPEI